MWEMFASYETHREIERVLYRDATAIDTGDFDGFASLFEHGQCSIWQSVPDFPIQAIAFTRFSGTFERIEGPWWWKTHDVVQDFEGDMSKHLKDPQSAFKDWQLA